MHKFNPPRCPQNICPVYGGVAVELTVLKYLGENPLAIVLVRLSETSRREPEAIVSSPTVISDPPTFISYIVKPATGFIFNSKGTGNHKVHPQNDLYKNFNLIIDIKTENPIKLNKFCFKI